MSASDSVPQNGIRVLVVDDHPAIRDALYEAFAVARDITCVGQTGSPEEALALVDQLKPDIVILDIALGTTHGIDLIHGLRLRHESLQVLIFSMFAEDVYAERAIRAGAAGYLMKNQPSIRVVEAVRSLAHGEIVLSYRMASRIISKVVRRGNTSVGFAIDEFTDREMAVFQLLGQGVPVDTIASQLHLSRKTVETYRRRAKEKLGFGSVSELLRYAVQWSHGHTHQN